MLTLASLAVDIWLVVFFLVGSDPDLAKLARSSSFKQPGYTFIEVPPQHYPRKIRISPIQSRYVFTDPGGFTLVELQPRSAEILPSRS